MMIWKALTAKTIVDACIGVSKHRAKKSVVTERPAAPAAEGPAPAPATGVTKR